MSNQDKTDTKNQKSNGNGNGAPAKDPSQTTTALAPVAFGEEIELAPRWWYQTEGDFIDFLPLKRSVDLRDRYGNDGPSYVWVCELVSDHKLSRGPDEPPIDGKRGDTFLMFEPSQPGVASMLAECAATSYAMRLHCDGKKPTLIRSMGKRVDVWQWRAQPSQYKVQPMSKPAQRLLPQPTGPQVQDPPF